MGVFDFTKRNKPRSTYDKKLNELTNVLSAQDKQLQAIQRAEEKYRDDIDGLILFWEQIWKEGGLLFNGSRWTFRLPDLYIKQKRYDDALKILRKIKKPEYAEKKHSYIERVTSLKEKAQIKSKK